MTKSRAKIIVISIVLLTAFVAFIIVFQRLSKIPLNDDYATGNTAGNLNNGGLFCEYGGKIYFSNPNDNGKLYSMNPDCTDAKKLSEDCVAYINACGKYLYYVRNNLATSRSVGIFHGQLTGVYRCELDGSNPTSLYSNPSGTISLAGNYIYYQHYDNTNALQLYKVKIDKTENIKIDDDEYEPGSVYNGKIYYANISNNHSIFSLDTLNGDRKSLVLDVNAYMVDMEGNFLYYIDQGNNYSLMRYNMSNRITEKLIDGRCVHYNLFGSKIFAMIENGNDNTGIYRMNIDGTQKELIAQGNFTNISCTSEYTYFQTFKDNVTLFRVPTTKPITNIDQILVK